MERSDRNAPLPAEMQGRWVDVGEPVSELIVEGGEITCFGKVVAYDYKDVGLEDGVRVVNLGIDDATKEDEFQRAHIIGLALTPDGELNVWNVKFASQFVQPAS